jgi:hypothetical protein
MEEFVIFRLFLAFPVIGLLIPDIGMIFSGIRFSRIPATHFIIEITLSVCIMVCSIGIRHFKNKEERRIIKDKMLVGV